MSGTTAGHNYRQRPAPFALVIFGASGDLTRRKLVPALFRIFCEELLPENFSIIGFARREKNDESFAAEMRRSIEPSAVEAQAWDRFARRLHYHRGDFGVPADFLALRKRIEELSRQDGFASDNCVFYLATQPDAFPAIVERLRESGLNRSVSDASPGPRLVVEKPFGSDLTTARALNRHILSAFPESRVFRIDHYLGKETVQNILVFRFANGIFEHLWNQRYIDHVQIAVSESVGVEGRGRYYDSAGALRDMLQNHMMHLLCFVAMEPPGDISPDAVRDEKVKVLKALRPIPPICAINGVVRAQYGPGMCEGKRVPGYREEEGVAPDSNTETFVALKAYIDNWRWAETPFYLRTGKRLARRFTQISVHFKPVPQVLFNRDPQNRLKPNVLILRIQPDEGVALRFQVKVPGVPLNIQPYSMDFSYEEDLGCKPPEAYQRLLLDAAAGDPTLFIRNDEVEAAWTFVQPIIEGCSGAAGGPLPTYPAGSTGPKEAEALIRSDGRTWEEFSQT